MTEINEARVDSPQKKRKDRPLIQNTAGQLEQEMKSRRYNLYELILAQAFLNVIFWAIWYPAELADNDLGRYISYGLLGVLGIIMLLTSPFRHRDTLKGLAILAMLLIRFAMGQRRARSFSLLSYVY